MFALGVRDDLRSRISLKRISDPIACRGREATNSTRRHLMLWIGGSIHPLEVVNPRETSLRFRVSDKTLRVQIVPHRCPTTTLEINSVTSWMVYIYMYENKYIRNK